MRYNNVYNTNETITLVVPAELENRDIYAYKYVYGSDKTPIAVMTNVMGNYKYIYINALNIDCYIIVKLGSETEFIRVGRPPVSILFRLENYIPEIVRNNVYDEEGNIIDTTVTEIPFTYKQYNYNSTLLSEGEPIDLNDDIYVIPVATIARSYFDLMGSIVTLTDPTKYASVNIDSLKGNILLQRGRWQLITLPLIGKIKDKFLVELENQTGVPYGDLVEVVGAYPGHINKFLSYIPGFTQDTDVENFDLIMDDKGNKEITAFWVKCKEWTHSQNDILFNWDNTK